MKNTRRTILKIGDNSSDNLKKLDFKHIGDGIYIHEFPCYKWNGFVTIIGRFTAYDDHDDINVDVFQEDGHLYAPYYRNDDSEVLVVVHSNIKKECRKCCIK